MEKSTDFVVIHQLTQLVHQGFGVYPGAGNGFSARSGQINFAQTLSKPSQISTEMPRGREQVRGPF